MSQYLEEAEQNKLNQEKKQAQLQHGWLGFPSKPGLLAPTKLANSGDIKVDQVPPPSSSPQQPQQHAQKGQLAEQKKAVEQPNPTNFRNSKPVASLDKVDPDVQQFILTDLKNSFNDLVGMNDVKRVIQEAIILPKLRPDLFEGLRSPPRGILLYGPPGNGKTFIAKIVAAESGCTFFNLSASSLVSKFMGDSEKMLRKVFAAAYQLAPSIIFVDEIDSVLTSRKDNEEEHCRRLKTEFLTQMEGISTSDSDHVVVIAATNLPQELDQAALRRFAKKIYVGPPSHEARIAFLEKILTQVPNNISRSDLEDISRRMDCYSASDINAVAAEACNIPVREVERYLRTIDAKNIRNVSKRDFIEAIDKVEPNLTKSELVKYVLHP